MQNAAACSPMQLLHTTKPELKNCRFLCENKKRPSLKKDICKVMQSRDTIHCAAFFLLFFFLFESVRKKASLGSKHERMLDKVTMFLHKLKRLITTFPIFLQQKMKADYYLTSFPIHIISRWDFLIENCNHKTFVICFYKKEGHHHFKTQEPMTK